MGGRREIINASSREVVMGGVEEKEEVQEEAEGRTYSTFKGQLWKKDKKEEISQIPNSRSSQSPKKLLNVPP
jgi:hypothetical protein